MRSSKRVIPKLILILVLLSGVIKGYADNVKSSATFFDWKQNFKIRALSQGLSKNTLDSALNKLKPDPEVLKLDANQPEFSKQIWEYLDRATSKARVKKGRRLLKRHLKILEEIESHYGVSKQIIVSIWAMESDFGANYGNKYIIRSLATLAYQGKRAEFAEQELLAALTIVQNRYANKKDMVGSWAGAIGQAQFMPTSFLRYAVDYDKDGKSDLWKTLPDVFASIANYLAESGWKENQGWGIEVLLPKDFDWKLNASGYQLSFLEWQQHGLEIAVKQGQKSDKQTTQSFPNPERQASLFVPAGKNGPIFLLTHNFDVIRLYNKSNSYALAVAQLSRLLSNSGSSIDIIASWPRDDDPLSHQQKEEIQVLLGLAGFDSGKIDGKIGTNTQNAIHTWQIKHGLAGDGYASMKLLEQLRRNEKSLQE